jgi:hypothetical protein
VKNPADCKPLFPPSPDPNTVALSPPPLREGQGEGDFLLTETALILNTMSLPKYGVGQFRAAIIRAVTLRERMKRRFYGNIRSADGKYPLISGVLL